MGRRKLLTIVDLNATEWRSGANGIVLCAFAIAGLNQPAEDIAFPEYDHTVSAYLDFCPGIATEYNLLSDLEHRLELFTVLLVLRAHRDDDPVRGLFDDIGRDIEPALGHLGLAEDPHCHAAGSREDLIALLD